jgi:hypothetical protein
MRPRSDEGRVEVLVANRPLKRLTQRVAVECDAETLLV